MQQVTYLISIFTQSNKFLSLLKALRATYAYTHQSDGQVSVVLIDLKSNNVDKQGKEYISMAIQLIPSV